MSRLVGPPEAAARRRVRTTGGRIGTLIHVEGTRARVRLGDGRTVNAHVAGLELLPQAMVVLDSPEVAALERLMSETRRHRKLDERPDLRGALDVLEAVMGRAAAS